jgi:Protein of unknown function (DUF3048) N-terminal domain/Protein of unknown function (DUF3048) C-terminal domain
MRRSLFSIGALAIALVLSLASCGGGSDKKSTTPAKPAVKVKAAAPVAPLTGLPDPNEIAGKRCAITVKIDNTQTGGSKIGVDQADVVYEEVVEGFITRLAAVFNSGAPSVVGPVRSVRKTDQSLVWPIGGIFAYSGGAQYAIDSINTAPVVQLDETRAGSLMFRDNSRPSWYTLFAHVDQMYAKCGKPVPPPALFTYRAANTPATGDPVASFNVGFQAGYDVDWTWDAASGTWKRSIFNRPETVTSGVQLAPKNVVVMFAQYLGGNDENLGAEAQLTGTGTAWVFTGGKVVKGTWSRPDKAQPAKFLDPTGAEIKLAPGQTWVEIPQSNYTVTVTPPPTPATSTPST